MKQSRLIWIITYTIAAVILGWAVFSWIEAANYHPAAPERALSHKYNYQTKATGLALSRYQDLLEGGLFFEKPPAPPVPETPKSVFHSELIVFGIVKGKDSRAIVGSQDESIQETWIVRPGSVVGAETVVAIGANYIEVRNWSGTGKVFLRE